MTDRIAQLSPLLDVLADEFVARLLDGEAGEVRTQTKTATGRGIPAAVCSSTGGQRVESLTAPERTATDLPLR